MIAYLSLYLHVESITLLVNDCQKEQFHVSLYNSQFVLPKQDKIHGIQDQIQSYMCFINETRDFFFLFFFPPCTHIYLNRRGHSLSTFLFGLLDSSSSFFLKGVKCMVKNRERRASLQLGELGSPSSLKPMSFVTPKSNQLSAEWGQSV